MSGRKVYIGVREQRIAIEQDFEREREKQRDQLTVCTAQKSHLHIWIPDPEQNI